MSTEVGRDQWRIGLGKDKTHPWMIYDATTAPVDNIGLYCFRTKPKAVMFKKYLTRS